MKKIFVLLTLVFQLIIVVGQTPQWGPWSDISCFKGFKMSTINHGFIKSINKYSWNVKIKNSYDRVVSFNMDWIVGGEKVGVGRFTLKPGQDYSHTSTYFKSSATTLTCEINKVCFSANFMDCSNNCFAICDNGSPNQPDCDTKKNTSSNTTSRESGNQLNNNQQSSSTSPDQNKQSSTESFAARMKVGISKGLSKDVSLLFALSKHDISTFLSRIDQAKQNSLSDMHMEEIYATSGHNIDVFKKRLQKGLKADLYEASYFFYLISDCSVGDYKTRMEEGKNNGLDDISIIMYALSKYDISTFKKRFEEGKKYFGLSKDEPYAFAVSGYHL